MTRLGHGVMLLVLGCLLVVLAGCRSGDSLFQRTVGPGQSAGGAVSGSDWTVRRVGPRELILSLTGAPPGEGPCGSRLRAVVVESSTQVQLSVVDDRDTGPADGGLVACPAVGHLWSLPVRLAEDLGARELVDPEGRVLELTLALAPAYLPDGYVLDGESGGPDHHVLNYGSPDGGWLMIDTWRAQEQPAAETPFQLVEQREVGGRPLRLLENELQRLVAVVEDDGRVAWVSFVRQTAESRAELSWDELVAVAASLE